MPWAALGAAAVTTAGSLYEGSQASSAAGKAAGQEMSAEQQALQYQQSIYGTAQSNLMPFVNSGNSALSSLMGLLGLGGGGQNSTSQSAFKAFTQTPSFTFAQGQGNLALNRQLASAGLTGSGAALKDATQYNQGYASQGLNSYLSQLSSVAGAGQSAAGTIGNIGMGIGSQVGSTLGAFGQAGAAGTVGSTNALNGGISSALAAFTGNNSGNTNNSLLTQLLGSMGGSSFGNNGSAGQTALTNLVNAQPS